MQIVFDSKTGNVKRFISKLGYDCLQIRDDLIVNESFILVTYTTGFGEVPKTTKAFLEKNSDYLIGVASSGNRNWGTKFAKSADIISAQYNVPIISKFELSGTLKDVTAFQEGVVSCQNGLN